MFGQIGRQAREWVSSLITPPAATIAPAAPPSTERTPKATDAGVQSTASSFTKAAVNPFSMWAGSTRMTSNFAGGGPIVAQAGTKRGSAGGPPNPPGQLGGPGPQGSLGAKSLADAAAEAAADSQRALLAKVESQQKADEAKAQKDLETARAGMGLPGATLTKVGDKTVLSGSAKDDHIDVKQLADGRLEVTTNGKSLTLTKEQSKNLVIRGGDGDDRIELDSSVTQGVRLEGGKGNDTLIGGKGNDTLIGGDGHDYLEGRGGDDKLKGNAGKDILYGGDGHDKLDGGSDRDYLDGGAGNNKLRGGLGDDTLVGGRDTSRLEGGRGNDVIISGGGKDKIDPGRGKDRIYAQKDDTITGNSSRDKIENVDLTRTNAAGKPLGSSIQVDGSPEFKSRVESDLATLRGTPQGQALLKSLDDSGKRIDLRETSFDLSRQVPLSPADSQIQKGGKPGKGSDAVVFYDPRSPVHQNGILDGKQEPWLVSPSVLGLVHELIHANDTVHGTGAGDGTTRVPGTSFDPKTPADVSNDELSTTGLPYDQNGDGKADPNKREFTENKFRDFFNVERRPMY